MPLSRRNILKTSAAGYDGRTLGSDEIYSNRSCRKCFAHSPFLDIRVIQGLSSRDGRYDDNTRLAAHDYDLKMMKPGMIAGNILRIRYGAAGGCDHDNPPSQG